MLAALAFADVALAQAAVTFELVPEERWNGGSPARDALLDDGTVRLYRQGSYDAAVEGRIGVPLVVPRGTWSWIAEGGGYVSVVGSTLEVAKDARADSPPRTILWPVVPACTLRLDGRWAGVERLDVVSLSRGASYPLNRPSAGETIQVPAGRWLVYGVRAGRLTGLGDPRGCQHEQTVLVTAPSLPGGDRQDVMLHLRLPADLEAGAGPLELVASGPGGAAFPATARASFGDRLRTFFFHDLPAAEPIDLTALHPLLRTARHALSPLGGSAREVKLNPRKRSDLVAEVDYRPRRPHHREEIELLRCDDARVAPDDCQEVARQPLQPGFTRYRFDAIDDGEYMVNARIDDEFVAGLGANFWFEIDAEAKDVEHTPIATLEEMEIWGHLLIDGERVEGTVRLLPRSNTVVVRVAPTDEESLLYRLFYFAQQPSEFDHRQLPEELQDLGDDELRGLYGWYEILACDAAGRCRSLPLRSYLIGSGRLDLDLGDGRGLDFELVDAETDEPLPRVPVLVRGGEESRLVFHDGEQWWLPKVGGEASPRRTDEDGVARIRDLDPGEVSWGVKQAGYRGRHGTATIPPTGVATLRVELERNGGAGDFELTWPGGEPLVGAYVLTFEPGGARRVRCVGASNRQGGVRLRRGCLSGARLVVLHPGARMALADGDEVAESRRWTVDRAPRPAPVVRVVGEDGEPIPGVPVEIEVATPSARDEGPWTIGSSELLAALGHHLQPLFYTTDADGIVTLRGVDPAGRLPLRVFVGMGRERTPVPLGTGSAGGPVEVVLER